ncbi:MAG TPA: J domain-containing protein [Bryobacteraceae bacterium]|nr:J domain-containing protein [Bryobacteraceae bacterium]
MRVEMRREPRQASTETYTVCWQDDNGLTRSVQVQLIDSSRSGLGFRSPAELKSGTTVFVQSREAARGYALVRHCARHQSVFIVGLELNEPCDATACTSNGPIDHYEFLQISPKAEFATIQRVYRFLAGRFHPDNPDTGDAEKFLLLKQAYEVLSDPQRRAAYDASRHTREAPPNPVFESIDYMDGIEGEVNRRLAVLSLLYSKRRSCPDEPRVSLADVESRMGFPREYLDFATWYLKSKKYITVEDNSDFALTALGVDFVEANAAKIPVLNKLLNSSPWGPKAAAGRPRSPFEDDVFRLPPGEAGAEAGKNGDGPKEAPLQLT